MAPPPYTPIPSSMAPSPPHISPTPSYPSPPHSLILLPSPPRPPAAVEAMATRDGTSSTIDLSDGRDSNAHLLEELEALSQSLYHSHTTRRTASLVLPRSAAPVPTDDSAAPVASGQSRARSRRMSLSPWRSRPGSSSQMEAPKGGGAAKKLETTATAGEEKKGIWGWKPIRALSHIGMQRLGCLFSVEVVAVQGLPTSMNGLRLAICVRKKDSREGTVQTMPARVAQGAADFEETLFIKCHVYCSGGGDKPLKFEPRPFLIYVAAIDAEELDFGRSAVDLSLLIQESVEKSSQGTRIRQWDTSFDLSGKAKGGELVLKLGFQIIEDKGMSIYSQAENLKSSKSPKSPSNLFARKQSKTSFSVQSPRITSRFEASTPSKSGGNGGSARELQGIDELDLDEPTPPPPPPPQVQDESKIEDLDMPEFEVVDKGIEFQDETEEVVEEEKSSASTEVVKEIVHDPMHRRRLTDLDSIAQQIKALESMIESEIPVKAEEGKMLHGLDADEETVTREFLQLLEEEEEGNGGFKLNFSDDTPMKSESREESAMESELKVFMPDLGKGLQSVVQTRDGGFLAAMNPLNVEVSRKDTPKLAMQISKPIVLPSGELGSGSGFELFQKMAGMGAEELKSELQAAAAMDELLGKTAEQIAFEGIASAIIQGRGKEEGASSSAARSVEAVKAMAAALGAGRRERVATGIWNVDEEAIALEEVLPFSLQKIEAMVVEALKIQAEMAEEEAPFDISPLRGSEDPRLLINSAKVLDKRAKEVLGKGGVTIMVVVQARDPLRRYEAVGGPVVALIQANHAKQGGNDKEEEEEKFKVSSLHVGGLKMKKGGEGEKQKLTAMQWVMAYGLGKAPAPGKKGGTKQGQGGKGPETLWSISARLMADMWLKPMRNPDVKLLK